MKTRPNNKIIIHWILIITISGLFLFFSKHSLELYVIVILMNMTLIFNRTSYLKLKANKLLITKNNLLFIPTYKSLVNLNQITRLSLIDSKAFDINNSDRHPEFEAVVAVEAITGTLFYKPDYILIIDLLEKNRMEFEINSDSKSLFDIISFLQNRLTQNH